MSPLKSTLEQLLARVAQLEERTARAEDRAVSAEEPSPRPAAVQNGNAAVTSNGHSISRRQALVKAAVAGGGGAGGGGAGAGGGRPPQPQGLPRSLQLARGYGKFRRCRALHRPRR